MRPEDLDPNNHYYMPMYVNGGCVAEVLITGISREVDQLMVHTEVEVKVISFDNAKDVPLSVDTFILRSCHIEYLVKDYDIARCRLMIFLSRGAPDSEGPFVGNVLRIEDPDEELRYYKDVYPEEFV